LKTLHQELKWRARKSKNIPGTLKILSNTKTSGDLNFSDWCQARLHLSVFKLQFSFLFDKHFSQNINERKSTLFAWFHFEAPFLLFLLFLFWTKLDKYPLHKSFKRASNLINWFLTMES
jgi:hypothetical protein